MDKKIIIRNLTKDILNDFGFNNDKKPDELFNIAKRVLDLKAPTVFERKVRAKCFAIIRGVLKMKKYGWIPHSKFSTLLNAIGFYKKDLKK